MILELLLLYNYFFKVVNHNNNYGKKIIILLIIKNKNFIKIFFYHTINKNKIIKLKINYYNNFLINANKCKNKMNFV